MKEETIIISLGGSLIVPDSIDIEFLKDFKKLIITQIDQGKKFIIVTGGGKICRRYHEAASSLANPTTEDLDWIGIASLKLNAELVRVVFEKYAHSKVISNLTENLDFDSPIIIGSAYEPGHSTDWDSVLAAKNVGAKKIINLSNIDHVYDSDPRINPNAKKIEKISWAEYRKLIPTEWTSGLNSPFDPTASEASEKEGIEVDILNGKNISNLEKCLNGEEFIGTQIK